MDYEKKYKKALKRAEALIAGETNTSDTLFYLNYIKDIFPELKESEDEKTRKGIIELVKQSSEILDKKNQERMLAWLEKQTNQSEEDETIELLAKDM